MTHQPSANPVEPFLLRALAEIEHALTALREPELPDRRAPAEPAPLDSWDRQVSAALGSVLGPQLADTITGDDAYSALNDHLRRYCRITGCDPTQALHTLDPDDTAFVARADNPAAFLARKISEL